MALGNLGVLYRIEGEYPKALEHHAQQLAIARQIGDKAVEASTLGNLGNVHYLLGDFANALQYHEQHLLLARALGTLPSEARALENVGATYHALGEYSKARQSIQDSLALARETGHRSSEASALGNLGNVYLSLGQYTRATEQYAQALDIAREIGEPETEATVLGNLGSLHYRLGDRRKALECYEDSLRLAREIGNRLGETRAIANLGNIYDSLGEHANARDHYERYLSLAREIGDRAGEAEVLGSLGGTLFGLGESAKSREACEQSLALFESLGIEEGALIPLAILARLLLAEGGVDEAYRELTKAQRILERPEFRSLETGEASSLRSQFAMWGEIAQDVTARRLVRGNLGLEGLTRVIREGFSQAGAWKGRALLEGIVEHRRGGRSRATIGLLRERREFHAKHEATLRRLSEAIRQGKSSEVIQGLRSEAEALRAHADRVSARLGEGSPPDAAVDLPPAGDPDALRVTVLDSATALVEYAPGEKSLYAYLLTRDRLEFIDLGENDAVDGEVRDFLAVVAVPAAGPGGVERLEAAGRRLFDRLLAPVLARTTERWEGILIVPSTSLAALPFEALVIGTKARGPRRSFADLEFVLDRYEITYAPSSPVLVELAGTGGRGGESKMLVLADPTLASGDLPVVASASSEGAPERVRGVARITPALEEFGRLPNTRREALAIAEVLSRHDTNRKAEIERGLNARSGSLSWPDFELRLGSQARPPRVDEELRSYSVLHLAAHGIVDRELPQRTGIALAPGGGPDDDGFLAIADVLELDLDADLVTLSACETARGASLRGEGIQSMARAFLYAGARSVVASLWLVEDEATAETMEGFYRRYLKEGMAPARALREAKLSLRKGVLSSSDARERGESVHPYFWAPFIYIGLP
jgi:CHAT domain-containing protein/tetratricopeptide (TPR) repeat protein